jgi:signal transduction histidine kinase
VPSGEADRLRDQLTRLRRLHEAALAIAAPVPPDAEAKAHLLGAIVSRAVEALGARSGRLVVAQDEPWRDLVPGTTPDEGHVTVRETGAVARERLRAAGDTLHVLATGDQVLVPDVEAPHPFGPFPAAQQRGVRSFAIVPLVSGGGILGTLTLDFDRTGELSPELRDVLALFAAHAAAALDRVRLLHLQQAHAKEIAARLEAEAAVRVRDEFLSIAAHELKTPITTLRGTVQHLLRQLARAEPDHPVDGALLERGLQRIDERSDKLVRLMSQLLDATRIQAGRLVLDRRPTDLVALAAGVIEAARAAAATHEFVLRTPGALVAEIDPLRVEQLLTNLVENAVRYAPTGTTVTVSVGQTTSGKARLAVRDQGPGIPEEHRERVFDRFYQVPLAGASAGMGLGLFVARQVAELHGGRIRVGAPKGGGARFVVTLPLKAPKTAPPT